MVKDLQADNNRSYRLFEKFSSESTAVAISGIALVVSAVFAIIAVLAMHSANEASATAETWQIMYKETDRECRLAQNDIDDFRIALFKAGIEVQHTGETD